MYDILQIGVLGDNGILLPLVSSHGKWKLPSVPYCSKLKYFIINILYFMGENVEG